MLLTNSQESNQPLQPHSECKWLTSRLNRSRAEQAAVFDWSAHCVKLWSLWLNIDMGQWSMQTLRVCCRLSLTCLALLDRFLWMVRAAALCWPVQPQLRQKICFLMSLSATVSKYCSESMWHGFIGCVHVITVCIVVLVKTAGLEQAKHVMAKGQIQASQKSNEDFQHSQSQFVKTEPQTVQ